VPADSDDRSPSSGLRGALSEVYLPALLNRSLAALAARLGPRAAVSDPWHGHAEGPEALEKLLAKAAGWLAERKAEYASTQFILGIERDVTEGMLSLQGPKGRADVPVAVVGERRPMREVEVRVYNAPGPPHEGATAPRAPLVAHDSTLSLPEIVSDHLQALRDGDIERSLRCFESNAVVVDSEGKVHSHKTGALRAFYEKERGARAHGKPEYLPGGASDDGRHCALELTVDPKDSAPHAALYVYARGDSGLLCALRLYD
jgi:hypothetical protein